MTTRDELIEVMAQAVRDFSPPWFPRKQKWHELDDRAKEHWRETGRAALTAIESAGLAIVPKEADREMQKRGAMEHAMGFQRIGTAETCASDIYRAMIEEGMVK